MRNFDCLLRIRIRSSQLSTRGLHLSRAEQFPSTQQQHKFALATVLMVTEAFPGVRFLPRRLCCVASAFTHDWFPLDFVRLRETLPLPTGARLFSSDAFLPAFHSPFVARRKFSPGYRYARKKTRKTTGHTYKRMYETFDNPLDTKHSRSGALPRLSARVVTAGRPAISSQRHSGHQSSTK